MRSLKRFALLVLVAAGALAQTARFPTNVVTDQYILNAYDRAANTLSAGIDNATLTIPVTDGTSFAGATYFSVTINDERILICSVSANTLTACSGGRGFAGSTAASHSQNATVRATITAWHHMALSAEIKAIETALGALMANVLQPGKHALFSPDNTYDIGANGATRPRNVYIGGTFYGALSGNVTGTVTGNASTATALAANGSNCSAGGAAGGVNASGAAENCIVVNVRPITFTLANPSTALDLIDIAHIWVNELDSNVTLASVTCHTDTDTGPATIGLWNGEDNAEVITGELLTCSVAGATTTSFSAGHNVFAAGDSLGFWIESNTNSKQVSISIKATY